MRMRRMWNRERKADMRVNTGLRWFRTAMAAGIVLTALGILTFGAAEGGASGRGMVLRAQAAESNGDEVFGRLDTFTGERISESGTGEAGENAISEKIWLSDNMFYDPTNKAYGYYAGDEIVYANVADGQVVKGKVSVKIPETVTAKLYWQGRAMNFPGGNVSQLGSYTVEVSDNTTTTQLFSFTIVGNKTNQLLNYSMPEGFRITKATLDGTEIDYTRKFVDMSKEGHYIISYECPKASVPYTLDVTVDTTPPTVVLEGVDEDGKARGPVAITQVVSEDTLVITRNGEEYKNYLASVLTQNGRYVVTVTDPAGNSTEYRFTILIYLDRNAWIFGGLFLLVVAVVAGLFVYFKKNLRVR